MTNSTFDPWNSNQRTSPFSQTKRNWYDGFFGGIARALGIGVFGGAVVLLVIAFMCLSFIFVYLSWNVMGLGHAMGFNDLEFWPLIAFTCFLAGGFFFRFLYLLLGFTLLPMLLPAGEAAVHMPELNFKNFVAVVMLLLVASASNSAKSSSNDS